MAAKKVSRATTKKLKDKWRAKQWYTIHAPELFESKEIPSTPADDPSKINGRVVEVTMQDLTGDFSKSYIKLKFRVIRIAGFDAYTNFIGHEFTSDYIRRLTRRRRTKVDGVFDVTTKDGYRIRVKPMAIAENRIQSSQKSAIRHQMDVIVNQLAEKQRMGEFVHSMISGDISRDIFRHCKHIYRLKRIDIRKSEILGQLSSHKAVEEEPQDIDAIPDEETEEGKEHLEAGEADISEPTGEEEVGTTPEDSTDEVAPAPAEMTEETTPEDSTDEVAQAPAEMTEETTPEDGQGEIIEDTSEPIEPPQDSTEEPAPEKEIVVEGTDEDAANPDEKAEPETEPITEETDSGTEPDEDQGERTKEDE